LFWFVTNSGAVPFLLGIGLIVWAVHVCAARPGNAESGQSARRLRSCSAQTARMIIDVRS
jgi:hypothetical protein